MSLVETLISLPPAVTFLVVVSIFTILSIAGLFIVRRFVPLALLREHNDVAGFIFSGVGVVYAVLLAMVVVAVWNSFDESDRATAEEAAHLGALYRSVEPLATDEADLVQEAVLAYVVSVAGDEWPRLRKGEDSPATEASLEELWTRVQRLTPDLPVGAWHAAVIDELRSLTELRKRRLSAATRRLPDVMVAMLILGGVVTVAYTYLYGVRNPYGHVVMTAALTATIALVVSLIIILDAPFFGEVSISPAPFVDLYAELSSRP